MATNWNLLREVMNSTIDACEAVEKSNPDLFAGEYGARSDFQEDVCVGDFLNRFWEYPEGAARDIVKLRSNLGAHQKHPPEIARAFVNTAVACAEAIDLPEKLLTKELADFDPHCVSGGHSVQSLLSGIPKIQNEWMVTGITKALAEFRDQEED